MQERRMTMTRETKVGVVVCLSFLCLVGVVLGTKLRGDATDDDDVIGISEPVAAANPNLPAAAIPTHPGNSNGPQVIPTVAVQNAQPLPPSPVRVDNPWTPAPQNTGLDLPPPPDKKETATAPMQSNVAAVPQSTPMPEPTDDDMLYIPFFGPVPKSALASAPVKTEEPEDIATILNGQGEKGKPDDIPVPKDVPPATADAKTSPAPAPDSVQDVPMPTAVSPAPAAQPAEFGPARRIPPVVDSTPPGPTQPAKADEVKLTVAPPPPAAVGTGSGAVLLAPKSQSEVPPRTESGTAGGLPTRTGGAPAVDSPPERPGQPIVQASANDTSRRVGAVPNVSTPAISVPVPGGSAATRPTAPNKPRVESWDEETYRVKAGDTFDKISMAHFNSKNYADALRRFNVTHPQASDKMRADPASLEAGEFVYIPPAYILEKRHSALIPGYKPQPEPTVGGDAARTSNSSPQTNVAVKEATDYKLYRVSPSGQNLREIARAALGNPERWNDIYKLNPTLDPSYAVRGSTILKVPADSTVPAANVPPPESR
jgi:hypothetical protein